MRLVRELITPDRASELLMLNTANRPVRPMIVSRYAADMLNGTWNCDTGETIKISKSGQMPDGQHRLHAVIKSGVSIYMHIAYDISDDAFEVIDSGLKRQARDVLFIAGAAYSSQLASLISRYYSLKSGINGSTNARNVITNARVLEIYNKNPDLWISIVQQVNSWYGTCNQILAPSQLGAYYTYLRDIDEDAAYEFFSELCGRGGSIIPAIAALKDKLIMDKISNRKMMATYKHAIIIKAWNFYRKGKDVKIFKLLQGEEMPTAI